MHGAQQGLAEFLSAHSRETTAPLVVRCNAECLALLNQGRAFVVPTAQYLHPGEMLQTIVGLALDVQVDCGDGPSDPLASYDVLEVVVQHSAEATMLRDGRLTRTVPAAAASWKRSYDLLSCSQLEQDAAASGPSSLAWSLPSTVDPQQRSLWWWSEPALWDDLTLTAVRQTDRLSPGSRPAPKLVSLSLSIAHRYTDSQVCRLRLVTEGARAWDPVVVSSPGDLNDCAVSQGPSDRYYACGTRVALETQVVGTGGQQFVRWESTPDGASPEWTVSNSTIWEMALETSAFVRAVYHTPARAAPVVPDGDAGERPWWLVAVALCALVAACLCACRNGRSARPASIVEMLSVDTPTRQPEPDAYAAFLLGSAHQRQTGV